MSSSSMTLTQANREWATRPADERMADLETMHARAVAQRDAAAEKEVPFATLRVEAQADNLYLGRGNALACRLGNWAINYGEPFGQYLAYEEDCDAAIILLELPQTRAGFSLEQVTDAALIQSLSYWREQYLLDRGIVPDADAVARRKAFDARYFTAVQS